MSANMTSGTTIDVMITEDADAAKPVIQEAERKAAADITRV